MRLKKILFPHVASVDCDLRFEQLQPVGGYGQQHHCRLGLDFPIRWHIRESEKQRLAGPDLQLELS